MNDDYSRFYVPAVRGMDDGSRNTRGSTQKGVRELAPFLYTGDAPWPFKYSITTKETQGEKKS